MDLSFVVNSQKSNENCPITNSCVLLYFVSEKFKPRDHVQIEIISNLLKAHKTDSIQQKLHTSVV